MKLLNCSLNNDYAIMFVRRQHLSQRLGAPRQQQVQPDEMNTIEVLSHVRAEGVKPCFFLSAGYRGAVDVMEGY